MADDLNRDGTLRKSTAVLMWTAYTAHAAATVVALTRPSTLPLPTVVARTVGPVTAVTGVGRFNGVGELTGTSKQPLLTNGIYAHTRNPQYLGYILAITGLALTRRSTLALGLAGALAATYAAWVPLEEEHMARTVGPAYRDYQHITARWWGHR